MLAYRHSLPDGRTISILRREGAAPILMFLPGYASDMRGTKAEALDALAAEHSLGCLRFDYSGTGESDGEFAEATLASWLEEAEAVAALVDGPLLLVGSSMGGWLMLHLAERLGSRVIGLIGIAAAPDFTEWGFDSGNRATLVKEGRLQRGSPGEGNSGLTTLDFWNSGQALRLLDRRILYDGPVRLLHGDQDKVVPLDIAIRLKDALVSTDVQLFIAEAGDHRMSGPAQIDLLRRAVLDLAGTTSSAN